MDPLLFFILYLLFLVAILLLLALGSWFSSRAFWRKHVRLENFEVEVIAQDGKPQPENKAFPDTAHILLRATLVFSRAEELKLVKLTVCAHNHTAKKYIVEELTVKDAGRGRVEVCFTLNSTRITGACGVWRGELGIGWFGVCLKKFEIEVPWCRSNLIESLEAKCLDIHVAKDASRSENALFAHVSTRPSISMIIKAVPRDWPPDKYTMPVWGRATHVSTKTTIPLAGARFTPAGDGIEARVPCDVVMNHGGMWKLEIGIEKKCLATKSFTAIGLSETNQSVAVESFHVGVLNNQGKAHPLGDTLYASETLSLQSRLVLATSFPSALVEYSVHLSATVGKTLVFEQTVGCVLSSAKTAVILPEIAVAALLSNGVADSGTIDIRLNTRHLVRKRFLFRESIPPFAQVEGLLLAEEALRTQHDKQSPRRVNSPSHAIPQIKQR